MSRPFSELPEGTTLILDPRTQVRITSYGADDEETATNIECRASSTIGDIRLRQQLPDSVVLVTVEPLRLLQDSRTIANILTLEDHLNVPIDLRIEEKQVLFVQPATLAHQRQELRVAISSAPIDLMDELRDSFQMVLQFRLVANSHPLNFFIPLVQQDITPEAIICLLYTSPSPRDLSTSRMPSSA